MMKDKKNCCILSCFGVFVQLIKIYNKQLLTLSSKSICYIFSGASIPNKPNPAFNTALTDKVNNSLAFFTLNSSTIIGHS